MNIEGTNSKYFLQGTDDNDTRNGFEGFDFVRELAGDYVLENLLGLDFLIGG